MVDWRTLEPRSMEPTARGRTIRFSSFRVDLRTGQIYKHGIRLKLQEQPFRVLALLLERHGDLVTREELHQKLWPADTFVDFDTGLNNAIKKLRDVLGDSAEKPRYIETLPRRGYRFIAELAAEPQEQPQLPGAVQPAAATPTAPEVIGSSGAITSTLAARSVRTKGIAWVLSGSGLLVLVLLGILRFGIPAARPPAGAADRIHPPKPQPTMGRALVIEHPSSNVEANELLQRAVILMHLQYDPLQARAMLERSLELDPNFTEARAYHAVTHIIAVEGGISNDRGDIFRAEEELRGVAAENPNMALAHAMLGAAHFFHGQMDLAREEYLQAILLAPGDLGGEMWLVIQQRFLGSEEAVRGAQRLTESEPLFWPARYVHGEILREQGRTAEAVRAFEVVLGRDPQNSTVLICLARANLDAGELPKARQTLERLRPQDASNHRVRLARAQLYAAEGKRPLALKEMDEEVLKYADVQPFAALDAAEVYALLGETDKAMEWLDRTMRKGDGRAQWLRIDPLLDNVRQHPRFHQILSSVEVRSRKFNTPPRDQS